MVGAPVDVRWTDGELYGAKFKGTNVEVMYIVSTVFYFDKIENQVSIFFNITIEHYPLKINKHIIFVNNSNSMHFPFPLLKVY